MNTNDQKTLAEKFKAGDKIEFFSAHFDRVETCTFGMAGTCDAAGNWNASTYREDGSRVTLWFGNDRIIARNNEPLKTWRDELAAGVFEDGLTDKGLDRHDFKDISKQTLKAIIDAAYNRGLAEATRDARLPHNR